MGDVHYSAYLYDFTLYRHEHNLRYIHTECWKTIIHNFIYHNLIVSCQWVERAREGKRDRDPVHPYSLTVRNSPICSTSPSVYSTISFLLWWLCDWKYVKLQLLTNLRSFVVSDRPFSFPYPGPLSCCHESRGLLHVSWAFPLYPLLLWGQSPPCLLGSPPPSFAAMDPPVSACLL